MDVKDYKVCPLCRGKGFVPRSNGVDINKMEVCPVCHGNGKVTETTSKKRQHIHKYWGDMYFK